MWQCHIPFYVSRRERCLYIAALFWHNREPEGGALPLKRIELPTLLFWENGNSWYGSLDSTRFFIKPEAPGGAEEKQLTVRVWRGPLEMALSEMLATAAFPVTEEGLKQTAAWLEERAAELNENAPIQ